ncbi:mannose-1-phosphate guanylyltransferase [Iodidimonas gelatinilytica]|uniref:Mannose-1-phosphate guanylyltransferase n=1 Tax=Iodidimonas gelatinilytica TaxID=1236966 RepID=A0A5A7MY04_9PROT|nr:nucleotidyltransferase family protein [Iodidimonas gelatinilytica]GER00951.1 mannose-1-phosphate guanylyltransferase [Iodidimonas gelatinilytica]
MAKDAVSKTIPLKMRARFDAPAPKTAMLLAAGLGTRMMPLTEDRPKALVELNHRPLIDYTIKHLERAGVERLVVNVHAHADRLQEWLSKHDTSLDIRISDERDQLLDTGGALLKAAPLLGDDPFFVLNCDAFWCDGLVDTLAHLASRWTTQEMDALLLIVHSRNALAYHGRGDFEMDPLGRLSFRAERTITPYVYAGVQILDPAVIKSISDPVFSLRKPWAHSAENERLFGLVHEGAWAHVGSPDAVRLVERTLLD